MCLCSARWFERRDLSQRFIADVEDQGVPRRRHDDLAEATQAFTPEVGTRIHRWVIDCVSDLRTID
jgi:hypothetical protein